MLETEHFEENKNSSQPKSFIVAGLAILIIGIASGAAYRFNQITQTETDMEAVEGTVEEQQSPQITTDQTPVVEPAGSLRGAASTGTDIEVKPPPLPKPPAASVKPPSPSPARGEGKKVVDICADAKKTKDGKYAVADQEYANTTASAKLTFDSEQLDFQTKLNTLARARNDAINQYLTAIAIATSKYNSSSETNAYEVYQQEQSAALTTYTDAVAKINAEEMPEIAAKKDSEAKYQSAVAAAVGKRDQDKAAADADFNRVTADKC